MELPQTWFIMQNSLMLSCTDKVAVVCNDAGGANIVIAWLKNNNFIMRPFMKGPARRLWEVAYPKQPIFSSLEQAIDGADTLIAGTGWASDLEFEALQYAKLKNVYSISVLDHWVNYEDRFVRRSITIHPNAIWVTDEYAYALALEVFPAVTIKRIGNAYIQSLITKLNNVIGEGVLYIAEPIRGDWNSCEGAEYEVLDYIKSSLKTLKIDKQIVIRPHPSEDPNKYSEYVKKNIEFTLSRNTELSADIAKAELVLGLESMALVVALKAGRRVVSCLPSWAPSCRLPHKGISHLKDMSE